METKNNGIGGIALFAIIIVIAALGGTFVYMYGKNTMPAQKKTVQTSTMAPESATVTPVDTSDAGLEKDSASVDTKLKAADADSANIDAGLNDVQGNLSEQ